MNISLNDRIKILCCLIYRKKSKITLFVTKKPSFNMFIIQYNAELDYDNEGERCLQK